MTRTGTNGTARGNKRPFVVRVLSRAIPMAAMLSLLLGLTGYPPNEWATVSVAFMLCATASGTVMPVAALLVLKRTYTHVLESASRAGVAINPDRDTNTAQKPLVLLLAGVPMLVLGLASWGLSFYALTVVMQQLDMAPIAKDLGPVTLVLFVSCSLVYVAFFGSIAGVLRLIANNPQRWRLLRRQLLQWMEDITAIRPPAVIGMPSVIGYGMVADPSPATGRE